MKKLYILIRKDLSPSQQAVQAGHAVAEFLLRGPKTEWSNGTLVYLGVRNEFDLYDWIHMFDLDNIHYSIFKEPDRNDEVTAIATDIEHPKFRKLQLM